MQFHKTASAPKAEVILRLLALTNGLEGHGFPVVVAPVHFQEIVAEAAI